MIFVSVAAVLIKASTFCKKVCESNNSKKDSGSSPNSLAFCNLEKSKYAPATSVFPSIPSELFY